MVSVTGGQGDVLAAVVDGGQNGGLDGQSGHWLLGGGDGGGQGLVESTTVAKAASMAVGLGGSESRKEQGGNSGDVHVG